MKKKFALFTMVLLAVTGMVACGSKKGTPLSSDIKDNEEVAVITTSLGVIKVRFFPDQAPKAVENFITHSKNGYYDGVIFHRVIKDFMVQTGDPTGTGSGGDSIFGGGFEVESSVDLGHIRGTLSMANTGYPNSTTSQFFIVQTSEFVSQDFTFDDLDYIIENQDAEIGDTGKTIKDYYPADLMKLYRDNGGTQYLDGKHTVFGMVFEGMDVVDAIAAVETSKEEETVDRPLEEVKIISVEIVKYKDIK